MKKPLTPEQRARKTLLQRQRRAANRDLVNEKKREYRKANPEKSRKEYRAYRVANPEKTRAAQQKWREKNKDKLREYESARHKSRTDSDKERRSKWVKENAEKFRMYASNRRAKKLVHAKTLTQDFICYLYKLQRGKCACCGLPLGDNYHIDHIMPLALGGTHEERNIQLLRSTCNQEKHAKHPIEFMQQRGFLL